MIGELMTWDGVLSQYCRERKWIDGLNLAIDIYQGIIVINIFRKITRIL